MSFKLWDEPLRARQGFTLIELMVVVAIIAFVTAAVVPTFGLALQKGRQRDAGNIVVQAVFAARSRAARTGRCHRVRVMFGGPGNSGGTGGAVAVDTSLLASCTQARNLGVWQRLSYKSVWESSDPMSGDFHAGIVGQDVAITDDSGGQAGSDNLLFEPSGGMWLGSAREHRYRITAYDASGSVTGVQNQFVRISSGGSVYYGAQ